MKTFNPSFERKSPNSGQPLKIAVGLSGGVDSSVAAAVLKEQGHQVIGLFMKNWDEKGPNGECPADQDFQDVEKIGQQLGIPVYSVNFVQEYQELVFKEFLAEIEAGFTPNPDLLCNQYIKFDKFFNYAMKLGVDAVATGHYCQVMQNESGEYQLKKGTDANKDQTYFLASIEGKVLSRVLFPLGGMTKKEVRDKAKQLGLSTAEKKESMGICFIGKRPFREFVSQYIKSSRGDFRTLDGEVVGEHEGSCFYTLGQRKGLGLGGPGEPWFVVDKDHSNNTVFVERGEHQHLFSQGVVTRAGHWLSKTMNPEEWIGKKLQVRLRHRQAPQDAHIVDSHVVLDNDGGPGIRIKFDQPQRAATPGQYCVFYDQDVCLGAAKIDQIIR